MSREIQQIKLREVIDAATEAGEWVNNAEFDVFVSDTKPAQGKLPSKATITCVTNDRDSCELCAKEIDLTRYEGCIIRISGQAIKTKLYNGRCSIWVSAKTNLDVQKTGMQRESATPNHSGHHADMMARAKAETGEMKEPKFHLAMKRNALLYAHCMQYALDVLAKFPQMTPDNFQACVSTLFIKADRDGISATTPKLREVTDKGSPVPYQAPTASAEAQEAAKRAAEEQARKAAEEAARRQKELENEDVPF